jgi:hypothetical protein
LSELCQLAGTPGAPLGLSDVVLLVLMAYCLLPDFLPWFSGGDSGSQAFQPQQEQQLQEALVSAVMASSSSISSTLPRAQAGPDWLLEKLAARVAAAKQQPSPPAGGSGSIDEQEQELLQGLRLEARDAVEALLGRLRELSAFRRSQLKQLKSLAAAGQDGAPRPTPLLRQIVGAALAAHAAHSYSPLLQPTVLLEQQMSGSTLCHAELLPSAWLPGIISSFPLLRLPSCRHLCCPPAETILRDQPLPDLHAGATSLSGLLRSGLGRFGLQAGPKPSDCSTVILFVLGGISMAGDWLLEGANVAE